MVYAQYCKRPLDLLVSVLLLVILSWFFLLTALISLLVLKRPVFFKQDRIGKDERTFALYKFRTLRADDTLELQARRHGWGNFLRRLSVDELPQLVNVVKGDMSLVGPRPLPVEYLPLFSVDQRVRHQVRPGIAGLAQVSGRNSISWEEKFQLDIVYVRNLTFFMDCKVLLRTIILLLSFRKDTSLEEQKFTGSGNA
jgi:lipopolysaccharide/colanic/teichoic acid biosynthesis glycosyltransferase